MIQSYNLINKSINRPAREFMLIVRTRKVQDREEFDCPVSDAQHMWSGAAQNLESAYFPGWVGCYDMRSSRGHFVLHRGWQNFPPSRQSDSQLNMDRIQVWPKKWIYEVPSSFLQYHIQVQRRSLSYESVMNIAQSIYSHPNSV